MWQLALVAGSGVLVFVVFAWTRLRKAKLVAVRRELQELRVDNEYKQKIEELKTKQIKQADRLRDDPAALSDFLNDILGESNSD